MEDEDQLPFRWDDEGELPKGKRMSKARLDTFGDWWPYENVKGWFGTTKRMANAGFYYTPSDNSEDNVQCPYCGLGLDGWEAEDDPIHEHQRRKPTCAFFATRAAAPTKASTAKATKSKKQNNGSTEIQHSGDQKNHTSIADKQDLRKNSRIGGRAGKPSSQPIDSTEDIKTENNRHSNATTNSSSKKSDISILSSRSVEFDIPDTTSRGTSKKSKARTNSEGSTTISESQELEPKPEDLSDNGSYSSSTGQKRQKHRQDSEDESTSAIAPHQAMRSVISVVITKKRKLTKAERTHNSQSQDIIDMDKENIYQDTTTTSSSSEKSIQRGSRKVKDPGIDGNDSDQSSQQQDDEKSSDESKPVNRHRKSKRALEETEKPKSAVKSKRLLSRATKRNLRSAELLKSPAKKKASKALIEIFELPDEGESVKNEPLPLQQADTLDLKDPLQNASDQLPGDDKSTNDVDPIRTEELDDDGIPSTIPSTPPRSPLSAPSTPQQNSKITLEYPITPVHQQAVSIHDIENARVVVVDALTPNRRAASSVDIEGWEDEDRRESSPFVSPSKWDVSALSTSTPKSKKVLYRLTPSITSKQKVKDVVGNLKTPDRPGHATTFLSPQMKSPLKKTSRNTLLSPEKKQQRLINRLGNLMQDDDSTEVLAVANSALKEEVKLQRQSQNKEWKQSSTVMTGEKENENVTDYENEDIEMQEPDPNDQYNNESMVVTPVKKTSAFDITTATTPTNRTPLPISNVISALGAASRRNHQVAASPFVKTPVKKSVNLLKLGDVELTSNHGTKKSTQVETSTSKVHVDINPFLETKDEPDVSLEESDASKEFWGGQTLDRTERNTGNEGGEQLILHEDEKENKRRMKLLKESGLSERQLKMTVEEFHRVILEEQVRQLELLGEAWVQRFQEESDRVRAALLDDGERKLKNEDTVIFEE
ncbi:hypothetical protein BGZ76_011205 [Entomortierella beljakovae]|nr:hypothetical protein BGZ76_011205 [Entomortierella beljakovae]